MGIHVPQWIPCCYSYKIVYTVNKVACMKHHFCMYSSCYPPVTIQTRSSFLILYSGCYPPVTIQTGTSFLSSTQAVTHLLPYKQEHDFYSLLRLLPTCYRTNKIIISNPLLRLLPTCYHTNKIIISNPLLRLMARNDALASGHTVINVVI